MFSSLPSILLPALPFTFLTQSLHVVSSVTLRGSAPPPGIQLVKYFFRPHIEEIKKDLEEAKSMGSATAEEWVKGLETAGKDKLADAARWEQWEGNGGLRALISRQSVKPRDSDSQPSSLTGASQIPKSAVQFGAMRDLGSGHSSPTTNVRSANDSSSASPARVQFPQGRITSQRKYVP